MRRDEGDLEAADEESADEQEVAAVGKCFAQRLADGLLEFALRLGARGGVAPQRIGQERHEQHQYAHDDKAVRPAVGGDQPLAQRSEEEHARRTGCCADPECERALLRSHIAGKGRQDDPEGTCRNAEPDQDAATDMERGNGGASRHQDEARRIEKTGKNQHPSRAVFVGQCAEDRLAKPPAQVLYRHGEAEGRTVPAGVCKHRELEKAHGGARPERQDGNQRACDDDRPGHGRSDGRGHQCVSPV